MRITTLTLNPAIDQTLRVAALRRDDVSRVQDVRREAGGKGLNIARTLALLGRPALSLALLGGAAGQDLANLALAAGITLRAISVEGETRTNIKIVEDDGVLTQLNFPGPACNDMTQARIVRAIEEALPHTDVLVLTGSLPPGLPDDFYATLMRQAREHDVRCVLDADGPALALGVAARPFIIKPNTHELERLTGTGIRDVADIVHAARDLHARGIAIVVVSRGPAGAVLVCEQGAWSATPPNVPAKNTVGCGDALVAGLLAALADEQSPSEALCKGVAVGSATAQSPGTHLHDPDAIQTMLAQTQLAREDA